MGFYKTNIFIMNKINNMCFSINFIQILIFDFKVNSDKKISYKKIIPISTSQCEVKKRDITFGNGTITLKYDDRNVTNLLKNVDDFRIYKNGNLVFIKILLGDIELIKPISLMSYNI